MAIHNFDGTSDIFYLSDTIFSARDFFRPTVKFIGSDFISLNDPFALHGPFGLVKFFGADSFQFPEPSQFPAGSKLVNENHRKTESISFSESSTMGFPKSFVKTEGISRDTGLGDQTDFTEVSSFSLGIRTLSKSESFGFLESSVFVADNPLFDGRDLFRIHDSGFIEHIDRYAEHVEDIFEFEEDSDFNVITGVKRGTDSIIFHEAPCLCFHVRRENIDVISFSEYYSFRIKGKPIEQSGELPGGHGATFKATIKWNRVEQINLLEEAYRVDDDGNPIPDSSCCVEEVVVPSGDSWASLLGWGDLDGWDDLEE